MTLEVALYFEGSGPEWYISSMYSRDSNNDNNNDNNNDDDDGDDDNNNNNSNNNNNNNERISRAPFHVKHAQLR